METAAKSLQCIIVTPERAVLDDTVDFVALPMFDGELGVLPGRSPLIGRLGYGELRTRGGQETRRYFVDGGFAQVRANVVTVLTSRATKAEQLDAAAAAKALEMANQPGKTPEEQDRQWKDQQRARAQLHMARRVRGEAQ